MSVEYKMKYVMNNKIPWKDDRKEFLTHIIRFENQVIGFTLILDILNSFCVFLVVHSDLVWETASLSDSVSFVINIGQFCKDIWDDR